MVEAPPWDPFSTDFSAQEQNMFNYRGRFNSPNTPARGQSFINSATLYAYDAADVKDDENNATVLESFVTTMSLPVAQVNTKKVPGLTIWCLPRSGVYRPRKYLIWFIIPHSMVSAQCCIHPCLGSLGQMIISYGAEGYHMMCRVINYLPLQCSGKATNVHRILPPILTAHAHSPWSWKVKPIRHCPYFFSRMGCHWL